MSKVFLGGTCNESTWRETLIPMLTIDYFNPVVKDWTPECQKEEEKQKQICDWQLYVISKEMTGVFSIAEVVDSSNKNPDKTILCVYNINEFPKFQQKSLKAVMDLVDANGAHVVATLEEVSEILNAASNTDKIKEEYEHQTISGTKEEVITQLNQLDKTWIYESDNFDNDIYNITVKRRINS